MCMGGIMREEEKAGEGKYCKGRVSRGSKRRRKLWRKRLGKGGEAKC